MQSAGDRVAAAAELAAGVQHGEHELDGGDALGGVHVDRDAAAVVDDGQAAVRAHDDLDVVAVARERLVDGVVDDLVDQVVQAARPRRADVHAGALADRLEALEDLDLVRAVVAGGLRRHAGGVRRLRRAASAGAEGPVEPFASRSFAAGLTWSRSARGS